jgi:hypothetical protein
MVGRWLCRGRGLHQGLLSNRRGTGCRASGDRSAAAPIFDTAALETAIANLRADVDAHRQEFQAFTAEVHGWKSEAGAFLAKYVLPELATVIATWKLAK